MFDPVFCILDLVSHHKAMWLSHFIANVQNEKKKKPGPNKQKPLTHHARSQKFMRGGFDSWSAEPARGVRGHAPPPGIFFENLMQNSAFWGNLEKKIEFNSAFLL